MRGVEDDAGDHLRASELLAIGRALLARRSRYVFGEMV